MEKFNVYGVSLPRTGTTSLNSMFEIFGFKAKHPPSCYFAQYVQQGYNAFSDTPCFVPSFIKREVLLGKNHKFIYIDRNPEEWIISFENFKLHKAYEQIAKMSSANPVIAMDAIAYGEAFGWDGVYDRDKFIQKHIEHKRIIQTIIPEDRLLIYKFDEGWESICKFLDKDIPNVSIPHKNASKP